MSIILVLVLYHLIYRSEIRKIRKEVDFIINHETNKQITSALFITDLNQLTDSLNELIQLQKSISQKHIIKDREFKKTITNISHDIRTPLTSLTGYFQLLNESDSEEERDRYINIINNRIDSLKNLLENNFIYLKIQDDSYKTNSRKLDLSQLVQNNLLSYYEEFKNKKIEPKIEIPNRPVFIMANSEAINRIIHNLITNSLIHGEEFIHLSLFEKNEMMHLIFENGIVHRDTIELDNVFDRFYKNDQARTVNSTGLGLTIVKDLVESMDGQIKAKIETGIFRIEIKFKSVN